LFEIVEPKPGHGKLPLFRKEMAGAPRRGGAGIGGSSSPPEGLLGFASDVAPRQPDIVQVPVGPLGELAAGLVTLPPRMNGLAQMGQNAQTMMICHRLVRVGRHFRLLKLIFRSQYLSYWTVPQTTLCTASHEISS
jgi:hypothetical protein